MRKRPVVGLWTVGLWMMALLTLLEVDARAQECPEAPESPEEARRIAGEAFTDGQRLFEASNYSDALESFQCSFSVVPHANTLFNIGQCKESLGDLEGALRTYRSYLELFPEGEGRALAEENIRDLEARIADSQPPEEPPQPESSADSQEPQDVPTRMTLARTMAWVSLGLGVAIGAAGAGLYVASVVRHDNFITEQAQEPVSVTLPELQDMKSSGQAMETSGWVLMGLALATLTASVVLFTVFDGREPISDSDTNAQSGLRLGITPQVIGDGGGLLMSGSF